MLELSPISFVFGVGLGICIGLFLGKRKDSKSTSNVTENEKASSFSDFGEYKMVMVVRQDLGMAKGKAAAQCCHAAVDVYNKAKKSHPNWVSTWENFGCQKVALKCPDEETLLALYAHARELGIATRVVVDAGRTQIPSGSKTVVGIGPAPIDLIDKVTGHLKLF